MKRTIKNILLFGLITIETLSLTSTSSFALCYSSKTNGEEIHQRSCGDTFQATGALTVYFEDGSGSNGTATLIAPDVLLTTAHGLVNPGKKIHEICFQPTCVARSPITDDMVQQPKNVWIHPNYIHTDKVENHDIAIIQLSKALDNIRPAQLQKTLPDDFAFADTTVVGYGLSGNNYEGAIFDDQKRRAGDMTLWQYPNEQHLLYKVFAPNKNGSGFIDYPNGSKYATIAAQGDSGGPAFIQINGEPFPRILGILQGQKTTVRLHETETTSSTKTLEDYQFMSIPYYYPWIESKLKLCNHIENINNKPTVLDYFKHEISYSQFVKNVFSSTNEVPNASPDYTKEQEEIAWNNMKEALSTASQQGSEVLHSLYDYALSPENKQAFEDILSGVSQKGLELLYEYIALHKELFFE